MNKLEVGMKTHIGNNRQVNEDCGDVFYNENQIMLAVVADGMGGHQAGDVASEMVVQHLHEQFASTADEKDRNGWQQWLNQAIAGANSFVYEQAQKNVALQGMGTTVVATLFLKDEYIVAHVGDSRIYTYHIGNLQVLTEDHSLVNELVRSGHLTKEEAAEHPQRNIITRALGTEQEVNIDTQVHQYEDGQYILLCSDGLSNFVEENEIKDVLEEDYSVADKADKLVQLALDHGSDDNITLIIVHAPPTAQKTRVR